MRVVDLDEDTLPLYLVCLEDWSAEMREAGDHKRCWYEHQRTRGLRVKLALDEDGAVAGMIQYVPAEHSMVQGPGLYVVLCVWVHGYKDKGIGDRRHKGMGRALLAATEEDARALGAGGLVTWGLALPFFMRARWFRRQGYTPVDRVDGFQVLLWKRFREDAQPPRWLRARKTPAAGEDAVDVTAFLNGWCPAMSIAVERARRAAAAVGSGVRFQVVDTRDDAARAEWGRFDGVFIDGKALRFGPPPKYEKVEKKIRKAVMRRGLS